MPLTATTRSFKRIVCAADAGLRETLGRLHSVVAGIDAEDLHNHDHSANVADYAVAVGAALGFDTLRLTKLQRAAFLHDIGKASIASTILGKRGPLDADEVAIMELHPAAGAVVLEAAGLIEESRWVRAHHERADGSGYPDGLAGDEIPMEARILQVVDSFEAMTSDRPYRRGMTTGDALAELWRGAGLQFDAVVVAALADLIEGGRMRIRAVRSDAAPRATAPRRLRRAPGTRQRGHTGRRCEPTVGARVGRAPPGG